MLAGRFSAGSGDSRRLPLGLLDPPLDLAHRVEVLARPSCDPPAPSRPCSRAMSSSTQSRMLAFRRSLGAARVGRAAVAEQPFEQHARIGFARQRRGRRRPRQVVLVHAGEAVVAVADLRDQVGAELERRNRRVAADLPAPRSDRSSSPARSRCLRSASRGRSSGMPIRPSHGCRRRRRSSAPRGC